MKQLILFISLGLVALGCKKKTAEPKTNGQVQNSAMNAPAKCNSLNDYAVKSSQATFIPAQEGGDSGEEHLDIKDMGLEQGFEIARNCLSELKDITFEKFEAAKFQHEIQEEGLFVTISLKKTANGVRITYSAGI